MKQLFKNTTAVVLGLGLAVSAIAASDDFQLKANIQTQGKASYENDAFDSFWFRANFGGKYASEDMDAQVMIRMYGPKFGNTIEEKSYDKFLADLYWADYKWDLGANKLDLKLGHWKTDWSQSGNFGTYIDPNLKTRGFLMRDYSHDAFEAGWKYGPSALHAMIATSDSKFKTGYVRVEERLQLAKPFEIGAAYRVNAIDAMYLPAVQTHRVAGNASFTFIKNLRLYGEVAYITTGEDDAITDETVDAGLAIAPEYEQNSDYLPFFVGIELPTAGLFDNLMFEMERINDRDELMNKDVSDFAWTVSMIKSFGHTKTQLNLFSEDELNDVAVALRITTTIK